MVDEHDNVVMDHLVRPRAPVTDYKTQFVMHALSRVPMLMVCDRFSGITEAMLADVTLRLEDVQKMLQVWTLGLYGGDAQSLQETLPGSAILVGHSLENDLRALRAWHTLHHPAYDITTIVLTAGARACD